MQEIDNLQSVEIDFTDYVLKSILQQKPRRIFKVEIDFIDYVMKKSMLQIQFIEEESNPR